MSHHPEVPDDHYRPTYEDIHQHIASTARQIRATFRPDLIVAIGGGGFFPARVLRTFLKRNVGGDKLVNVPIQAIGLSLYEDLASDETNTSGPTAKGKIGLEVVRTQWLDAPKREGDDALTGGLLGKNILIVDEVDDSRTTLQYAYNELVSDVRKSLEALSPEQRAKVGPTRFAIFVVHNKLRNKKGTLPIVWSNHATVAPQPNETQAPAKLASGEELVEKRNDGNGKVVEGLWYFAAETTGDIWVEYPWEQEDIEEHNRIAAVAKKLGVNTGAVESSS